MSAKLTKGIRMSNTNYYKVIDLMKELNVKRNTINNWISLFGSKSGNEFCKKLKPNGPITQKKVSGKIYLSQELAFRIKCCSFYRDLWNKCGLPARTITYGFEVCDIIWIMNKYDGDYQSCYDWLIRGLNNITSESELSSYITLKLDELCGFQDIGKVDEIDFYEEDEL